MRGIKSSGMKQVRLSLYNYGIKTEIADFKNNCHDAMICMKCLNDRLVKAHSELPENIFYYMTYKQKGKISTWVDYTNVTLAGEMTTDWKYKQKIDSMNNAVQVS